MNNPNPRFTGIFIPKEILEKEELTLFEMMLLSWIDALYCEQHGGCFASNEYLGKRLRNTKENTIAKSLTKLRKLGLIENVSFDGRKRVIRALTSDHVNKCQSKSGLDKNPTRVGQKSNPNLDKNPTPSYIVESKAYNKVDKEIHAPLSSDAFSCPNFSNKKIERAQDVATTEAEHSKLLAKYGEELTAECYEELASWKKSATPSQVKKHSSDYRRITKWVALELLEGKSKEVKLLKPVPTQQGISAAEINRQWAKETFSSADRNKIKCWQDFIEIQVQGRKVTIFYHEHGFQEQARNALEKADLQPLKNLKTAGAL